MKYFYIFFFIAVVLAAKAQDAMPFADGITALDMQRHVEALANADMEGRETGTEGNRKAARYIVDKFERYALPPIASLQSTYTQPMLFNSETWSNIELYVGKRRFRHSYHFFALPDRNGDLPTLTMDKVVFAGYGIAEKKYNDYKRSKVKGKVVMIMAGEPTDEKGVSYITGTSEKSEWTTDWKKKMTAAFQQGAKAVLIIEPDFEKKLDDARSVFTWTYFGKTRKMETIYPNNCGINWELANAIAGKDSIKLQETIAKINKTGKPKSLKFDTELRLTQEKRFYQLISDNILGYVEGSDPILKDELVIVSAHYDHLGRRGDEIYYGADDNASGTAAVLEICQALTEAKKAGKGTKRSVLCMLVTGEEKGLLGSKYYTEFPVFPLESTVANVNIDMIGRIDDKHKDNPNYIYVIGADKLSSDLHRINEEMNSTYTHLELDYTYNDEKDPNRYYYRSDHYNFVQHGIPAVFFFNGTHGDYHRTTDTVDKINFAKMEKITRLAFFTTWELANRTERIKVDKM